MPIDGSSFCPHSDKHAPFHCLIPRLVPTLLTDHVFRKQLDSIKHIVRTNNVKLDVEKLARNKSIALSLDATTTRLGNLSKRKKGKTLPQFAGATSIPRNLVLKVVGLKQFFSNIKIITESICFLFL